jgi:hypothetical protein
MVYLKKLKPGTTLMLTQWDVEAFPQTRGDLMKRTIEIQIEAKKYVEIPEIWDWMNVKIKDSIITQVILHGLDSSIFADYELAKGRLDIFSTSEVSNEELETLFKPYPDFIRKIVFKTVR